MAPNLRGREPHPEYLEDPSALPQIVDESVGYIGTLLFDANAHRREYFVGVPQVGDEFFEGRLFEVLENPCGPAE